MIMVSLRVGERASPLAWRMKKTQGAIGFGGQKEALEAVAALLPERARVTLMGDRFYGSPALIDWCREKGWGWRLRCKQDLLVFQDGGETTLAECFARGEHMLADVELTEKRARTHVAMLHEEGHPEPWIIALSDPPTTWRAQDYGLRWGIEAMFSDYKTRGFNLERSFQIHGSGTDRGLQPALAPSPRRLRLRTSSMIGPSQIVPEEERKGWRAPRQAQAAERLSGFHEPGGGRPPDWRGGTNSAHLVLSFQNVLLSWHGDGVPQNRPQADDSCCVETRGGSNVATHRLRWVFCCGGGLDDEHLNPAAF